MVDDREETQGALGLCWGEPLDVNIHKEDGALLLSVERGRLGTEEQLKTVSWVCNGVLDFLTSPSVASLFAQVTFLPCHK